MEIELELKKKSSSLGPMVLGRAGRGQLGAGDTSVPGSLTLCRPLPSTLCAASLLPRAGFFLGQGAGLPWGAEAQPAAQEEGNLLLPSEPPRTHPDGPSGDHMLTPLLTRRAVPAPPPVHSFRQTGLLESACPLCARYSAIRL